jgi:hypothetical protein
MGTLVTPIHGGNARNVADVSGASRVFQPQMADD